MVVCAATWAPRGEDRGPHLPSARAERRAYWCNGTVEGVELQRRHLWLPRLLDGNGQGMDEYEVGVVCFVLAHMAPLWTLDASRGLREM